MKIRRKVATLIGVAALIVAGIAVGAGPAQARTELADNEGGNQYVGNMSFNLDAFDHNFVSYYQDQLPYTVDATAPWATGKLGLGVVGSPTVSGSGGVNGSGIVTFTGSSQALATSVTTSSTAFSGDGNNNIGVVAGSDNASMQVVFKTTSATVQTLFQRIGTHSGKFTLGLDASGHVTCSGTTSATTSPPTWTATTSATYKDGNWHTATCTHLSGFNNAGAGAFVATVDGTSVSAGTTGDDETVVFSSSAASGHRAWFGESNAGTNQFLGSIDSIVWTKYPDYIAASPNSFDYQDLNALNMTYSTYSSTGLQSANGIVQDSLYWQQCASGANTCQVDPLKYKWSFDESDGNPDLTKDYFDVESYAHDWSSTNQVGTWGGCCNAGDHLYYGQASMGTLSPAPSDLFSSSSNVLARLNNDDSDLTNTAWTAQGSSVWTTSTRVGPDFSVGSAVDLPSPCNPGNSPCSQTSDDVNNTIDFTMAGVDWNPSSPQTSVPEFGASSTDSAAWGITFRTDAAWAQGQLTDGPNLFQQGYSDTTKSDAQIKIQIGKCQLGANCGVGGNGYGHDRAPECVFRDGGKDTTHGGTTPVDSALRVNADGTNVADGNWHTIICVKLPDQNVIAGDGSSHTSTPLYIVVDGVSHGPYYPTNDGNTPLNNGSNLRALGDFIYATDVSGGGTGTLGTNYGLAGNNYRPTLCGRMNWSTSAPGHYPALAEVKGGDNCNSSFAGFAQTTSSQTGGLDVQATMQHWLAQLAIADFYYP